MYPRGLMEQRFTLIDVGRPVEVAARIVAGSVELSPAALRAALGRDVGAQGAIDLAELAERLDRPLALDLDERAAYLGVAARERARALGSLEAPDFTLPDLAGRLHTLAEQRGKKVLLVAYASW
ncbi:MAG: hypothetical protein HY727_19355 [Candidatus Rokubacteria bacterium]|nr:hypothetical protein [Candidatus Rokubacteria bacterium]